MKINALDFQSSWHICSAIVQATPNEIEQVKTALLEIPNTEIAVTEPEQGKIIVVMQAENPRELMFNLEAARNIVGVISVSLVYHEQEWD